jgi:hypothetical protein
VIVRKKVPPVKGDEDHVGSTAVTKLIVEDSCKRASVRHSGRPSTYAAQLPTLLWVYVAALSRIGSYYWGAWTDQLSPLELVSIGRLQFVRLQCHPVSTQPDGWLWDDKNLSDIDNLVGLIVIINVSDIVFSDFRLISPAHNLDTVQTRIQHETAKHRIMKACCTVSALGSGRNACRWAQSLQVYRQRLWLYSLQGARLVSSASHTAWGSHISAARCIYSVGMLYSMCYVYTEAEHDGRQNARARESQIGLIVV